MVWMDMISFKGTTKAGHEELEIQLRKTIRASRLNQNSKNQTKNQRIAISFTRNLTYWTPSCDYSKIIKHSFQSAHIWFPNGYFFLSLGDSCKLPWIYASQSPDPDRNRKLEIVKWKVIEVLSSVRKFTSKICDAWRKGEGNEWG